MAKENSKTDDFGIQNVQPRHSKLVLLVPFSVFAVGFGIPFFLPIWASLVLSSAGMGAIGLINTSRNYGNVVNLDENAIPLNNRKIVVKTQQNSGENSEFAKKEERKKDKLGLDIPLD